MKLLLSVPEAARALGIPRNRGYEWVRAGLLPCIRDRGRIYVPAKAVHELIESILHGKVSRLESPQARPNAPVLRKAW